MSLDNMINEFRRAMKITVAARFHSVRRLNFRQTASSYLISLLSTYVILLSLLPNIVAVTAQGSQLLLSISIVVSIFIIFTSLLESSSNFHHKSESLHASARNVSLILNELDFADLSNNDGPRKLTELRGKYRDTLMECPFNHDQIDYLYARLEKPKLFAEHYSANGFGYLVQRWLDWSAYYLRLYAWLLPHLTVLLISGLLVAKFVLLAQPVAVPAPVPVQAPGH